MSSTAFGSQPETSLSPRPGAGTILVLGMGNDILTDDARLVIYGPFNYGGQYTSESNAVFNAWLKSQGAHQGLRDFEAVDALARQAGLVLIEDRAMPSNNRCLVWQRAHSPL